MSNKEKNFTDSRNLRSKAEEQLKENQNTMGMSVTEADTKKLMHELQVHQIELEMQNDELVKANETAEAALKKYTMMYDFAPMGYFTIEPDGSIIELNFTGAEILGDKRMSLVGTNFKLFISEDSKPEFNRFFKKVYESNSKESCSVKLEDESKPFRSVYMEGIVLSGENQCLLSVVDISTFKMMINS
jgi:PAS domain-containing protein